MMMMMVMMMIIMVLGRMKILMRVKKFKKMSTNKT